MTCKFKTKNAKFMDLLSRRGFTQQGFAESVEKAWSGISGRPLSRQAVNAWVNNREVPKLTPTETLAMLEVLGCTLTELAIAFSVNEKN